MEILLEIFLFHQSQVKLEAIVDYCSSKPQLPYKPTIAISHVCRHFRSVALDPPVLWSRTFFHRSDAWIKEVLERSKSAMLLVDFLLPGPNSKRASNFTVVDPVLQEIKRVRELTVTCKEPPSSFKLEERFRSLRMSSAPELRVLQISTSCPSLTRGECPQILHPDFLSGGAAQLARLELADCLFDWKTSVPPLLKSCTRLTVLSMINKLHRSVPPTLPQLLEVLTHMPDLRRLTMEHTLPVSSNKPATCRPAVHVVRLAELEYLRLLGSSVDCSSLLRCLDIPISAIARIKVTLPREVVPSESRTCSNQLHCISRHSVLLLVSKYGIQCYQIAVFISRHEHYAPLNFNQARRAN